MPPVFKTLEDMERFYYGDINPEMIKKADDALISSDTAYWNKIYGAKVWSEVNFEANAFAVLAKEPWIKTGWRLQTASGHSAPSGGEAEGAADAPIDIPDTVHPTTALISAPPKRVHHAWNMTELAALVQGYDDTQPISFFREECGLAHKLAMSAYLCQDVDTAASYGFESVDRMCASYAERNYVSTATDVTQIWLGPIVTRSDTSYDAHVSATGSATSNLRDLTLSLIDGVWTSVTEGGGKPSVFLTKANTVKVWNSLIEPERRYAAMQIATVVPRMGGAAGLQPGVEAGFSVATYFGTPIIPCQSYDSSIATARTNEVGPIAMIDNRYMRFAVLRPTQYLETDLGLDKVLREELVIKGYYSTVGELRCYFFGAQGKVRDIK